MGNDDYSLTEYRNAFNEFNKFINNIHTKPNYYEGYFVENKKFDDFKKQYEALLAKEQKMNVMQVQVQVQILDNYKMNTEKPELLQNNLFNNKEYIFINEGLYQFICKKNDEEKKNNLVNLYSSGTDFIICGKNNNTQILRLKKNPTNIFNKSSLYIGSSNSTNNSTQQIGNINNTTNNITNNSPSDNYNKMSQNIINFYKNQKNISEFLNSPNINNIRGFLVDDYWINNYKNYYTYDFIEANYLKNKINENQIQYTVSNISNYLYNKKIYNKYSEDISAHILQDINQIVTIDKNFILLDENFVNTYKNNPNILIKPNNFIITNNSIKVENYPFHFNTNKNLLNKNNLSNTAPNNNIQPQNPNYLTPKNNYNNDVEISHLLKHLLKYEYFKKEYYLNFPNYRTAFAIDYQIIKKLINIYNTDKISLQINTQINGITYQNFESNYQVVLNFINKYNLNNPSIQEINNLKKEMDQSSSFIKLFNNQSNRFYIDNFVLIDQEFATFLLQKINNNIKIYGVYYKLIENKFYMIIQLEQSYIYQISSFINSENFVAEYIIFSNYPNNTDISSYILSLFSTNKLQSLILQNMPINYPNNLQIYIYPINNKLNQITNVQQNNNFIKSGSINNFERINRIDDMTARTTIGIRISNNIGDNGYNQIIRNSSASPNYLNNTHLTTSYMNIDKDSYIKSNNNNFDENLLLSISIIKERQKLLNEIHSPNGNKNDPKKEYYLINKNYLKEISDKLELENIFTLIQQNQYKSDAELLNIAKTNLNDKIKKDLSGLNKKDMQQILKSKEKFGLNHYFVNNDKNSHLLYYKQCDIISEKLLEVLKKIDPDINTKCQKVECVFDKGIIIIFINKYIINVANFDNEIFIRHIILSSGQYNSFNLSQIFNQFSQKGYEDFMKSFVNSNNLINFKINQNYIVQANIINLTDDGKLVYQPSDRLKTMILFAVSQQYFNENQKEKVYLMNPEWLKEYKYNEIKEKVLRILNSRVYQWDLSYNIDSISNIIQYFDQEELKKFEEKVSKNRNVSFFPSLNPIQLLNKYIDSYKKFVLINDKMYDHFKRSFKISFINDNIYHIYKSPNIDFLCFQNYQSKNQYNLNNIQNYILIGNINREESKFGVSYILDYNDKNIIEKEMQYFIQRDFQNYIQNKICLSNPNEIFSPIFDNNQIIGNYYNISKGFDPKKCVNYSNLLSNNQLWANIYLYYNEITIARKLKNPSIIDEEFYLINKDLLSVIKTQNNYGQLKRYFIGKINYSLPGQKDLYNIIKSLPNNDLIYLNNNLKQVQIPPTGNNSYEVLIIPVPNPNDPNELYYVLDNFELIEKQIANEYLKNYPYHIMKCSILGNNTIVFHYPNNKFNNKKCLFLVSKIDEKNNFINEYLLIYEPNYIAYFDQIKNKLNKYLSSQYYINNTAPIELGRGIQIGTIINLTGKQSQMSTTTPTTPISSKVPTPIPTPPIPKPPIPTPPIPEEEYFPTDNFATNDSYQDFPSKPLVGLDNIGATCYMNATLQCLSDIKKFVDYFKYNPHLIQIVKNDTKKEKLCSAFKLVIEKLYNYKASNSYKMDLLKKGIYSQKIDLKSSYPPNNFKEIISIKNPLFKGIAANDAKDLVNFFIMTLHEELNRATPDASNNASNILLDQRNQTLMLQIFSDNFRKTNRSIISDLFYAMNCNITQCTNCNTVSYNYQVYFFLIFPLEEVRKFKLMNNGGNNNNYLNNMVDIYDCFDYDKKIGVMDGDNSMYCNYCKMTCPSSMCTLLTTGPEILIIILNRGQGIQFNVKINFHLELNLMNYIQLNNTGCNYELFGVITHIGTSDMGGHFIAYCKSYFKNDYNKWYRFNDSLVTPVNDFNKEVIQFAMPYLLFYKKKS